jgi:hypothetical protein
MSEMLCQQNFLRSVSHPWYSPASLPDGSGCWITMIRMSVLGQKASHLLLIRTNSGYGAVLTTACACQGCSATKSQIVALHAMVALGGRGGIVVPLIIIIMATRLQINHCMLQYVYFVSNRCVKRAGRDRKSQRTRVGTVSCCSFPFLNVNQWSVILYTWPWRLYTVLVASGKTWYFTLNEFVKCV